MFDVDALQWATGIFEGEGSVYLTRTPKGYPTLTVVLGANTDPAIIERLSRLAGWRPLTVGAYRQRPNEKQCWCVKVTGNVARRFLRLIYPFITKGSSKQTQAAIAMVYPVANQRTKDTAEQRKLRNILKDECFKALTRIKAAPFRALAT